MNMKIRKSTAFANANKALPFNITSNWQKEQIESWIMLQVCYSRDANVQVVCSSKIRFKTTMLWTRAIFYLEFYYSIIKIQFALTVGESHVYIDILIR